MTNLAVRQPPLDEREEGVQRPALEATAIAHLPAASDELPSRGVERAWDAGLDGRVILDRILDEAPSRLRPGGALIVLHSSVCREEAR